nr:paternally-expressed gene 3 protein-like isoform X1 [Procambarus clarkii]
MLAVSRRCHLMLKLFPYWKPNMMYQDSSVVEDAEYHIMYEHYDHIKLPQDPAATLKLTSVVHNQSPAVSGTESLDTVTLSEGEALASSALVNNALSSTTVLTTTSHTRTIPLSAPPLSVAGTLAVTSHAGANTVNVSPHTTANAIPSTSMNADNNFGDAAISASDTLTVATMSAVGSSTPSTASHVDMNQIVSTSDDAVIDGNLVTSSSIDAVVTSMVAPSDCQDVTGNGRKLPPQVIVKLLGEDSLSLDMVRIIAEQDVESIPHHLHGFSMLTRAGTLVHTKISENSIINGVGSNQYRANEVLRPAIRSERKNDTPCSVVWTCAYCNLVFTSSEAVACHQEKDCTENPNNLTFATSTSQSTVDALMSPLRQPEEPTYELKIEREPMRSDDAHNILDGHIPEDDVEDEADCETMWSCAVCGSEFTQPKDLSRHHMTHTVQELSSALFRFTTPHQKVKRRKNIAAPSSLTTTTIQNLQTNSSECRWNKERTDTAVTKIEEEMVDDPGDTPPHTPPQEHVKKFKRKPGPKAKPREKTEKRKYVRKLGEDGKLIRQREYKMPPAGQGSRDPHTCYICNKVLSSRGNLAKHLVLHNLNKPWMCEMCGMGFNAKRDHHHHYLQRHTNERPNICKVCGKGYVDSNYLLEHMVFHRQERPFSCDICGKLFRTSKCVVRHKKRHEKERHFTCALCFKSFAVKTDLTSHIRKVHHSDKKPQLVKQQHQPQQHQQQEQDSQVKSKDLTEFLLPGETPAHLIPEQLLPSDLESASLGGSVSAKDGIFISSDPLSVPSIIPISGSGENGVNCSYSVALTTPAGGPGASSSMGDHATYIMINSGDEEVAPHTVSSTDGLNIMYTTTPASAQQVTDLDGSHLDEMQHLSSSVGSSLVRGDGRLQNSSLHHPLGGQHQGQDTATINTDEPGLDDNQRSDLGLTGNSGDPSASDHCSTPGHAARDPNPGFHLELLSQTIQLELQRTQSSSASYLG